MNTAPLESSLHAGNQRLHQRWQARKKMTSGLAASDVTTRTLIGFPNPVNENAARTVAGGVLLLSPLSLVLSLTASQAWLWLTVPISLGFFARALTGPRFSPLGQRATKVVALHLGAPKPVAGPPKHFAQGIGTVVTAAAAASLGLGYPGATQVLLGLMIIAAGLESIFAFYVGCRIFGGLMLLGLIPEATCQACNHIWLRTD